MTWSNKVVPAKSMWTCIMSLLLKTSLPTAYCLLIRIVRLLTATGRNKPPIHRLLSKIVIGVVLHFIHIDHTQKHIAHKCRITSMALTLHNTTTVEPQLPETIILAKDTLKRKTLLKMIMHTPWWHANYYAKNNCFLLLRIMGTVTVTVRSWKLSLSGTILTLIIGNLSLPIFNKSVNRQYS